MRKTPYRDCLYLLAGTYIYYRYFVGELIYHIKFGSVWINGQSYGFSPYINSALIVLFSLAVPGGKTVAGGNVPIGTQIPKTFLWYPIGQVDNCPSTFPRLKGGIVVNIAVNIVTAKAAATTVLSCFNTLYLSCYYLWIRKVI